MEAMTQICNFCAFPEEIYREKAPDLDLKLKSTQNPDLTLRYKPELSDPYTFIKLQTKTQLLTKKNNEWAHSKHKARSEVENRASSIGFNASHTDRKKIARSEVKTEKKKHTKMGTEPKKTIKMRKKSKAYQTNLLKSEEMAHLF